MERWIIFIGTRKVAVVERDIFKILIILISKLDFCLLNHRQIQIRKIKFKISVFS